MLDEQTNWCSVAEAARLLRVNRSTVWRWISARKLPAYRVGPKSIRVRKADLEAVMRPARPLEEAISVAAGPGPSVDRRELARRQALVKRILANRADRVIAPTSAAELVQEAREQAQRSSG
jgi:excisionase family DNA binding protein